MRTTVVVIGGGQAGLAMSRCLTERAIDHIVLERGVVAEAWRSQRWDSLRLLTPNWMTRLPGWAYAGPDPDGYQRAAEVADTLRAYGRSFDAPVLEETPVLAVRRTGDGYTVHTPAGRWSCRAVVVATGAAGDPRIPGVADDLPATLDQLDPLAYRNPGQLDDGGGVLVVGASSSGVQIAEELVRHGHEVTLAVGEHVRLPRTYRGRDIHWWMSRIGVHQERFDEVEDLAKARRAPSSQLIGTPDRRDLGLNELIAAGVRITGRLVGVSGGRAQFSGSLANVVKSADLKQARLLDRIDAAVAENGIPADPAERPRPTVVPDAPTTLPLDGFRTVIWATGQRPRYPWLDPAALDRWGQIRHHGGVGELPGLYVLGLRFLRRRVSAFVGGVGLDAADLVHHLDRRLARGELAA